jgi:hypothetical protein
MTGARSPEAIGEVFAVDAWACCGRLLLLEALAELAERSNDPVAKQAFDRTLARIAADAPRIIRPKLQQRPQGRRKWS